MENKPANSLVVSLGKTLNGTPRLYVEDRCPRHHGDDNSQASADVPSKILRYNSFSRERRINMANKNKKKKTCYTHIILSCNQHGCHSFYARAKVSVKIFETETLAKSRDEAET